MSFTPGKKNLSEGSACGVVNTTEAVFKLQRKYCRHSSFISLRWSFLSPEYHHQETFLLLLPVMSFTLSKTF